MCFSLRRGTRLRDRLAGERGAYAILFGIIAVVIFTFAAIAVDLSSQTAYARDNRTRADSAALAAGSKLPGDPLGACNEAWKFIRANTADLPTKAVSPCASGVPYAFRTACDANTPATVYRATKTGPIYQISFTYPVPANDPSMQSRLGPPQIDGGPGERCQRMAVTIRSNHSTLFGGIIHPGKLSAPATAVVRARQVGEAKVPVALLILDPYGCNALLNSGQGGAYVYAADANTPGYISLDSDGTMKGNVNGPTDCTQGAVQSWTVDAGGTINTSIKACANFLDPANPANCTDPGVIDLYAFASGQTRCDIGVLTACQQSDVTNGLLYPQPQQEFYRATVLPAYRRWNCRGAGVSYPQYQPYPSSPAVPIGDCDHTDSSDSADHYIDNLVAALGGTGIPTGYCDLNAKPANGCPAVPSYANGVPCSLGPSDPAVIVPAGNWDITCPSNKAMSISNLVMFSTGSNIVVDHSLSTGSSTGNLILNSPMADTCDAAQPNVTLFFRGTASFSKDAQSSLTLCHTTVYITGNPKNGSPPNLSFGAGSGKLTWVAPLGGRFNGLALWSQGLYEHDLGGQAFLNLQGVFFTPFASPFQFTGQPGLNQTQAQFVTFRMRIAGQGTLTMVPNPSNALLVKKFGWALIR